MISGSYKNEKPISMYINKRFSLIMSRYGYLEYIGSQISSCKFVFYSQEAYFPLPDPKQPKVIIYLLLTT